MLGTALCVRLQWRRQWTQPLSSCRVKCLASGEEKRWLVGALENVHCQKLAYVLWDWEQNVAQLHKPVCYNRAWKTCWMGLRKVDLWDPGGCYSSLAKLNGVPTCRKWKGQWKSHQSSKVTCHGWELGVVSTFIDQEKSSTEENKR